MTGNQKKLTDIHNLIASCSNFVISSLLAQDKIVMDDLNMALDCQAIFWKEKAKMNWFMVGDRNTTFFHSVVKKKDIMLVVYTNLLLVILFLKALSSLKILFLISIMI